MSGMIERAAELILDFARKYWAETVGDDSVRVARAALLAALDPEDKALVEIAAWAIFRRGFHVDDVEEAVRAKWNEWPDEQARARKKAKAAVAALRDHILAGTDDAT